jgi:hypothetical protein
MPLVSDGVFVRHDALSDITSRDAVPQPVQNDD